VQAACSRQSAPIGAAPTQGAAARRGSGQVCVLSVEQFLSVECSYMHQEPISCCSVILHIW
jgi:hypothetical protein